MKKTTEKKMKPYMKMMMYATKLKNGMKLTVEIKKMLEIDIVFKMKMI